MSAGERGTGPRIELVLASDIEERRLLALLDQHDKIPEAAFTKACDDLGIKPSWGDVAMSCGDTADPPNEHGRALYTENRISMVIMHLWDRGERALDPRLLYLTVGGVRYLAGIDECADDLRLLKATGLLPQRAP